MNIFWARAFGLMVSLTALPLLACGDDDPTGPTPADLAGTYELVSITVPGHGGVGPPVATGTGTLTQTTYQFTITINLAPPLGQTIQDEGTYTIDGNTWSQTSTTTGAQSTGTFTFDGTRLELSTTLEDQELSMVWNKTS
jgi:hypothetical protein